MHLSTSGGCSPSSSGGKGTTVDKENQAAAGFEWWKEHTNRRNQRHEGHAGCQGEKSQCFAEKGNPHTFYSPFFTYSTVPVCILPLVI